LRTPPFLLELDLCATRHRIGNCIEASVWTSVARVTEACAHRLRSSGGKASAKTNLANQYTQSCDRTNV